MLAAVVSRTENERGMSLGLFKMALEFGSTLQNCRIIYFRPSHFNFLPLEDTWITPESHQILQLLRLNYGVSREDLFDGFLDTDVADLVIFESIEKYCAGASEDEFVLSFAALLAVCKDLANWIGQHRKNQSSQPSVIVSFSGGQDCSVERLQNVCKRFTSTLTLVD